jgi:hypothetical protein
MYTKNRRSLRDGASAAVIEGRVAVSSRPSGENATPVS